RVTQGCGVTIWAHVATEPVPPDVARSIGAVVPAHRGPHRQGLAYGQPERLHFRGRDGDVAPRHLITHRSSSSMDLDTGCTPGFMGKTLDELPLGPAAIDVERCRRKFIHYM